MISIDDAGRVTSINRTAEEITAYKLEEVYREEIGDVFPGLLEWCRCEWLVPGPGLGKTTVFALRDQVPEKGWNRDDPGFSSSPLKDSSDREIGSILIFQDLTALRAMEEDLKRADRLAAIGALAAGMAHEVRNPLASISGSIEILKEELENLPPTTAHGDHPAGSGPSQLSYCRFFAVCQAHRPGEGRDLPE